MITLLTGVPGSGKSYYSVYRLLEDYKSKKYDYYYTNISNLNKDLIPNYSKNIYNFNYDLFYDHIKKMYLIYKKNGDNDDELLQYVKDHKFYNSFFIVDEAHNYFRKSDDYLTWFLSYHRHLHLDMLFVTQNISLFYRDYIGFCEQFIESQRTSNRLFSFSFKYFVHSSFPFLKPQGKGQIGTVVKTFSIKQDSNIFKIYKSGDSVSVDKNPKRIILYTVLPVFIFLFLVVYFGLSSFSSDSSVKVVSSSVPVSVSSSDSKKLVVDDFVHLRFHCVVLKNSLGYCYSRDLYSPDYDSFPDLDLPVYEVSHVFNRLKGQELIYTSKDVVNSSDDYGVFEYDYYVDRNFIFKYFDKWSSLFIVKPVLIDPIDDNESQSIFSKIKSPL